MLQRQTQIGDNRSPVICEIKDRDMRQSIHDKKPTTFI